MTTILNFDRYADENEQILVNGVLHNIWMLIVVCEYSRTK
jgi:hypothetical protein